MCATGALLVARWSDSTAVTPKGGNRRSFHGHWVSLFLAPIHPRVCGEQDRDLYSRMAEDGSSPGGDLLEENASVGPASGSISV